MVHALREAWRILVADGTLLDLRPVAESGPLEVVRESGLVAVGRIEPSREAFDDDTASDRAIESVVADGFFAPLAQTDFAFGFYFDGVDELKLHVETQGRRRQRIPSEPELAPARREMSTSRPGDRLRWTQRVILCAYRRVQRSQ